MPSLVVQTGKNKSGGGVWEIKWTWLPWFIATDQQLHREVEKEMGKKFRYHPGLPGVEAMMTEYLIRLVVQRYPMHGLQEALSALWRIKVDGSGVIGLSATSKDRSTTTQAEGDTP